MEKLGALSESDPRCNMSLKREALESTSYAALKTGSSDLRCGATPFERAEKCQDRVRDVLCARGRVCP
jgi:hypothetical protein